VPPLLATAATHRAFENRRWPCVNLVPPPPSSSYLSIFPKWELSVCTRAPPFPHNFSPPTTPPPCPTPGRQICAAPLLCAAAAGLQSCSSRIHTETYAEGRTHGGGGGGGSTHPGRGAWGLNCGGAAHTDRLIRVVLNCGGFALAYVARSAPAPCSQGGTFIEPIYSNGSLYYYNGGFF
jgi:hypothetical protein